MTTKRTGQNGAFGSADSIEASQLNCEVLDIPEWGGKFRVRELKLTETKGLAVDSADLGDDNAAGNIDRLARVAVMALVKEDGEQLFEDADHGYEVLMGKSVSSVRVVAETAMRLSGMTQEAAEEIAGNSPAAPSDSRLSQ